MTPMDIKKAFSLIILFFVVGFATAQSTRDVQAPTPPKPVYKSEKETKTKLFKRNKEQADEEVVQFRKRMKKVARKKRKEERMALKPQYSDPLYFGHKRPPRKRKNGKKKFCKECGMTH
jgi:hypothetical protein